MGRVVCQVTIGTGLGDRTVEWARGGWPSEPDATGRLCARKSEVGASGGRTDVTGDHDMSKSNIVGHELVDGVGTNELLLNAKFGEHIWDIKS